MSTSMYQRIMNLATQLRQETSVKKRREMAQELMDLLTEDRVRKKLIAEATHHATRRNTDDTDEDEEGENRLSVPLRRWCALTQMWRVIILNALVATKKMASGSGGKKRVKMTQFDILLPYNLLRLCDQHVPCNEDNLVRAKLHQNEVKELLHYCLDMLSMAQRHADEGGTSGRRGADEFADVAEAERNLLEMMLYLCSRIEHVAHYRPDEDIQSILGEVVEGRLKYYAFGSSTRKNKSMSRSEDLEKVVIAAKIMDALLTSCQKLGVGLHNVVSNCLHLISKWATQQQQQDELSSSTTTTETTSTINTTKMLPSMLHSVTVLLTCHPEVAIAPMSQCGRPILSLALKHYAKATYSLQKEMFHDYLIAHIVMCQVAARLQGLMPCDLGNVGSASLSLRKLDSMLTLVLGEVEKMLVDATTQAKAATSSRAKQQSGNKQKLSLAWQPLSHRQRRHLELGARLMACAQRSYWSQKGFESMEDPTQELAEKHFGQVMQSQASTDGTADVPAALVSSKRPPKEQMASLDNLMASPWVKHVLQPLMDLIPAECLTPNQRSGYSSSNAVVNAALDESKPPAIVQSNLPFGSCLEHYPVLQRLYEQRQQRESASVKAVAPIISIIAACAEAFASGGCWSSFEADYWWTIPPKDPLEEDELEVIGCSANDFAQVLFLLSCVLEMQGRHHANTHTELQHGVLLCLIKFTHCTAVMSHRARQKEDFDVAMVETVWRRIWNIVFRSDLRYASFTQAAQSRLSAGELVLLLVNEMVRWHCTDLNHYKSAKRATNRSSTFLSSNQVCVWNLPVFCDAAKVEGAAPFLLLCSMLQNAGISDIGGDGIDDTWMKRSMGAESPLAAQDSAGRNWRQFGRRSRLMAFCMGVLIRLPQLGASIGEGARSPRHLFGPLAASIAALVHGQGMLLPSLETLFYHGMDVLSPDQTNEIEMLSFTTFPAYTDGPNASIGNAPELYAPLWQLPAMFLAKSPRRIADSDRVDHVQKTVLTLRHITNVPMDSHADFLSPRDSSLLHNFLRRFLLEVIWPGVGISDSEDLDEPKSTNESLDIGSLSLRTLALKVVLSVCLSGSKTQIADEVDRVSGIIASTLQDVLSNIQALCGSKDELESVLTDVLQIFRALSATSLSTGVRYVPAVTLASRSLAETCKTLLLNYAKVRRNGMNSQDLQQKGSEAYRRDIEDDEMPGTKSVNEPNLSSDAESDENKGGLKRSKRRSEGKRHTRQRISKPPTAEALTIAPPNCFAAGRIASILIALRPSFSNAKLVVECMLGTPFNGSTDGFADEVDFPTLIFCFGILCNQGVILHEEVLRTRETEGDTSSIETANDAILPLCMDVIRQARHEADPSSIFLLIGYDVCAELAQQREKDGRVDPMSKRLAKALTGLLAVGNNRNEVRSHRRRPNIRADWLRATTSVFKCGRENMHSVLDQEFRKYLLCSLRDLSETVRKSATLAVGAAVFVLPEQHKIYKRVADELPPIASTSDDSKFRKWCSQSDVGEKTESTSAENSVWEDSFLSLRFESVFCRAVIAGATSEYSLFREILFELVYHSFSYPSVEPLAFQACCKIASMRRYESCEAMLHFECEGMIQQWLERGEDFGKMPLLLSDPQLLRHLLRNNLGPKISFANESSERLKARVDFQALKEEASASFLYKYRDLVVPLAYIKANIDRTLDNTTGVEEKQDRCIREICYILVGNDPSFEVARRQILRKHIQDIIALCFSLMMSNDDTSKRIGSKAFHALRADVSIELLARFSSNDAHVAVRRLLEISGKFEHQIGMFSQSQQGYSNALYALMKELVGETGRKGDVFGAVGCSATEYLLYSVSWLERASLPIQKTCCWASIEIITDILCTQLRRGDYDGIQLGFCMSVILELLTRPHLSCIKHMALKTLKGVLGEVLQGSKNEVLRKEVSFVLRRIVAVCLVVHEDGQKTFLSRCLQQHKESEIRIRGCLGFLLLTDGTERANAKANGIWGWDQGGGGDSDEDSVMKSAVSEYGERVETRVLDSMVATYEVLEMVAKLIDLMDFSGMGFLNSGLLTTVKASHTSILAKRDKRLCAQNIFAQLFEDKKNATKNDITQMMFSGISEAISNDRHSLLRSSALPDVSGNFEEDLAGFGALTGLTPEQRLLWIELSQLALQLQQYPSGGATREELSSLVGDLVGLCAAPYPEPLRCAASRCLAEADPSLLQNLSTNLLENYSNKNPEKCSAGARDFLLSIHVRCFELLATYMKSASSKSALVAMETARALLATNDGAKAWAQVEIYECKALIAPLRSRKVRNSSSCLLPGNYFDEVIADISDCDISENTTPDWCWDERFWKTDPTMSFESFIQRLVTGLIACCYVKSETTDNNDAASQVRGTSHFFPLCQKMCSLEHDFAATVFPGIVLNLLQNDITEMRGFSTPGKAVASSVDKSATSTRSLANDRLSAAFSRLLSRFVAQRHGSDQEMVALVVATLDLLRRASQTAFTTSRDHKPNTEPSAVASARSSSQLKLTSSQQQLQSCPDWAGVPFGTVLALDGWIVAQACLRIKRAASALLHVDLYAEARFQGSGAVLSRLEDTSLQRQSGRITSRVSQFDCSPGHSADFDSSDDALSMIRLLKQSFHQLHECDNLRAIENHSTAVHQARATAESGDIDVSATSLWELQLLDAQSTRTNTSRGAVSLKVATSLERLGLGSILERYIHALVGDRDLWDRLTEDDSSALKEKWFQGQLHHGHWNEDIWQMEAPVAADSLPLRGKEHGGFYECTYESLSALLRDDVHSCRTSLESARRALLQDSSNVFSHESLFAGLEKVIDKLRATNKIEMFVVSQNPFEILQNWGLQKDSHEHYNIFDFDSASLAVADFTLLMRDVILQIFYSRQPPQVLLSEESLLVAHLWQTCASSRHQGRPDKADSALERLRSIFGEGKDVQSKLRLQLEDAMNMESRGDFTGAIRSVKNLIKSFRMFQGQDGKLDLVYECLLADSLAKCGSWMAEYKVEPAKSILEAYLLPASAHSNSIYEVKKSRQNAVRASASLLSLAHLASSLHESTLTRIRSSEWKTSGRIMQDRENELRKCEPLVKAAELRHNKFQAPFRSKNQKNQSKDALAAERDFMDLYVYKERLRKELRFLTSEREKMERSVRQHLSRALKSFGKALAIAGTENTGVMHQHVFKLISLWLTNYNQTGEGEDINDTMKEVFETVPTFRFVPLTYQIFSRLGIEGDGPDMMFQDLLKKLVFQMCDDHPYHCIVQLIALSNGMKVEVGTGMGTSERTANDFRNNVGDSKSAAASEVLTALERQGTAYVSQLVNSYQVVTDAYMQLAMASTTEFHQGARAKKPILISQVCGPKHRLDNCLRAGPKSPTFCSPCILTKPPPLRPGCDYGEGKEDPIGAERIDRFENSFTITETGINRPKVVMCIGSKGGKFRQLVKGQDDIRQDAIMQQVFQYVNDLFVYREMKPSSKPSSVSNTTSHKFDSSSSSKSNLKLVTYHIVPLSPITGVLEWVENAIPIGDYLNDRGTRGPENAGAHSRYYPGEWATKRCREHLKNAPDDEKRRSFDELCKMHSPCFRFFFLERFGDSPSAWFTAKMKYARSVAVSSIVGHMLGIGDRHSNNILIHQKTGEVVHIDFGIVFEQGKLLTKPEVVPFRLTRNIVDGLGPCGTEGAFTSAAEATAVALRENSSALLTILSAVVSDPLYKWSISPIKALQRQRAAFQNDDDGDETPIGRLMPQVSAASNGVEQRDNEAATQAISRIHEKLQGYEDGTAGEQQSVESQVQLLINCARDASNLCVMFEGWAPWS